VNVKGGKRKRETWCLECYNLRRRFGRKDSIERMKKLGRRRGDLCLSDEYVNSKSKLLWKCDRGHCWRSVPGSTRRGSWSGLRANSEIDARGISLVGGPQERQMSMILGAIEPLRHSRRRAKRRGQRDVGSSARLQTEER
jgi:hypothetical protein